MFKKFKTPSLPSNSLYETYTSNAQSGIEAREAIRNIREELKRLNTEVTTIDENTNPNDHEVLLHVTDCIRVITKKNHDVTSAANSMNLFNTASKLSEMHSKLLEIKRFIQAIDADKLIICGDKSRAAAQAVVDVFDIYCRLRSKDDDKVAFKRQTLIERMSIYDQKQASEQTPVTTMTI